MILLSGTRCLAAHMWCVVGWMAEFFSDLQLWELLLILQPFDLLRSSVPLWKGLNLLNLHIFRVFTIFSANAGVFELILKKITSVASRQGNLINWLVFIRASVKKEWNEKTNLILGMLFCPSLGKSTYQLLCITEIFKPDKKCQFSIESIGYSRVHEICRTKSNISHLYYNNSSGSVHLFVRSICKSLFQSPFPSIDINFKHRFEILVTQGAF